MKPKILVVDDSSLNREVLTHSLDQTIYDVIPCESGEKCLSIVRNNPIDLILLDIVMEGISGIGVLRYIRKQFSQMELPIIMVTGKSDDEDIIEALSLGANDYITKPITPDVAIARVQTQLNLKLLYEKSMKITELATLNSMIITYNHEINSPLTAAMMLLEKLTDQDPHKEKLKKSLIRINDILAKIKTLTLNSNIEYSHYIDQTQMIDLKNTANNE
ncbi:MAG: response regulator [Bacteriovoracaceae bacterium]